MTNRAAKRRAIADKLSADIARLPAAIAKCGEGTKARARLEAQLARAKARIEAARDEANKAETADRLKRAKLDRIQKANAGYMRRLDALKADAPALTAQWTKERDGEGKRLASRRKQLQKRTYKDTKGNAQAAEQQNWWRRPVKLPEPIQQPDMVSATEPEPLLPPPREGLIPGTFKLVDPSRLGGVIDRARLPKAWTARHVGTRLIEAHRVLGRIPMRIWPAEYGSAWPAHQSEFSDQVVQAGAGTLFSSRRSAPPRGASAEEMARCTQAISWPLQFLMHDRAAAADLNWWAFDTATDDFEFDSRSAPWKTLQFIADALNAQHEVVT